MDWLPPEKINALAADPAHCMPTDLRVVSNPRSPWVPEAFTQLYYTRSTPGCTTSTGCATTSSLRSGSTSAS